MLKLPESMENNQALAANIIVYDVGSTYTKAAAFNLTDQQLVFLQRGQAPTTLHDVMIGVLSAQAQITAAGIIIADHVKRYATCSAAGGLRMVALGYMPRVTAKAAKEVAMTAGARVMEVISSEESAEYREEVLREIRPDIILLAGGTDGGDHESVMENVQVIIRTRSRAKVIIACNREVQGFAFQSLTEHGIDCLRVPNIMPNIHELNVKPAREAIHSLFIKQITNAKGLDQLTEILDDQTVMPTPGAVLLANELLAQGTHEQEGVGSLILIDLGGATTDIHSALPELDELELEERGLIINNEKQFSYRTVEGNLGMRVIATGILNSVGPLAIIRALPAQAPVITIQEIEEYCQELEVKTDRLPVNKKEQAIDHALAACAISVALRRHAGHLAQEADPLMGLAVGTAVGRDLRNAKSILAVGGIFTFATPSEKQAILQKAFADPGISLLPQHPSFFFDDHYLLYAMGALARHYPEAALNFLKESIITR